MDRSYPSRSYPGKNGQNIPAVPVSKTAAEGRKMAIIQENIAFLYGRQPTTAASGAAMDPDKGKMVKSQPKYVDSNAISDFHATGQHYCLLPSFPCNVYLYSAPNHTAASTTEGLFPSFDHALQASKCLALDERQLILQTKDIRDVKKMAGKLMSNKPTQDKWKEKCLVIAEALLRDKFVRSKDLTAQLKATGKSSLIYGNVR